ncbi:MAG: APC family permease, partial [Pyrinomonadaceae bacterium]
RVATAVLQQIFGPTGAYLMAAAIIISTFGCNNGLILAGGRVYYAMARDGLFFAKIGTLNARHVPAFALVVQGIWAALLTLPRTLTLSPADGRTPVFGNVYTQLLEYIISADLVFYALMVGAVPLLRRQRPDAPRPYRTPGYPLVPLIYIALALLLVIDLAYLTPSTSGLGYLLVLTGLPIYFVWRRNKVQSPKSKVQSQETVS